jgi:hypothetical protein
MPGFASSGTQSPFVTRAMTFPFGRTCDPSYEAEGSCQLQVEMPDETESEFEPIAPKIQLPATPFSGVFSQWSVPGSNR